MTVRLSEDDTVLTKFTIAKQDGRYAVFNDLVLFCLCEDKEKADLCCIGLNMMLRWKIAGVTPEGLSDLIIGAAFINGTLDTLKRYG